MFDLIVILIPLFPLLAMLANGLNVMLGHRYSDEIAHRLGWGSVLLSFLCALWVFGQTLGHPEPRTVIAYRWFFGGDLAVNLGFLVDPLTCVMMLVVTGVGFLIHVYSVGYMHGEEGFTRFFAYMNLFMVSMLLLVMRSEEHTSELQSRLHLVCRLLLEKKKKKTNHHMSTAHAR